MNFSIVYKQKEPTVVVNGDALYDGAKTAVLSFGVEEVKLSEFKEETAELVHSELFILPLPCKSCIMLLQGPIAFGN